MLYNREWWGLTLPMMKARIKLIAAQDNHNDTDFNKDVYKWITIPTQRLHRSKERILAFMNEDMLRYGVRPPNVLERARALGMEEYHSSLQLDEATVLDLQ